MNGITNNPTNMAATALKIESNGRVVHLLVLSIPGEDENLDLAIHNTASDYEVIPNLTPEYGVSAKNEENYHKDLRKDAHLEGHFVPEFSTNPEWNPGVEEKESIDGENRGD